VAEQRLIDQQNDESGASWICDDGMHAPRRGDCNPRCAANRSARTEPIQQRQGDYGVP
jgi:hypothetical protein